MTCARTSRRQRGFTLVELMIAVAIIGVLASTAIPEYYRATLRARATERGTIMDGITRAIDQTVSLNEGVPDGNWTGDWNPAAVPGTAKGHFVQSAGGWARIPLVVQGDTYYQYYFQALDPQANGHDVTLTIMGRGDLDGDGNPSTRVDAYVGVGNSMQPDPNPANWTAEDPFVF